MRLREDTWFMVLTLLWSLVCGEIDCLFCVETRILTLIFPCNTRALQQGAVCTLAFSCCTLNYMQWPGKLFQFSSWLYMCICYWHTAKARSSGTLARLKKNDWTSGLLYMTRQRYLEQALKTKIMNDSLALLEGPRPAHRFSAFMQS